MRLIDELNDLHAHYARAVDVAVADDDVAGAERLADAYTDEAIRLMAEREGKTHLLPLYFPQQADTPLRRLVARLRMRRAA